MRSPGAPLISEGANGFLQLGHRTRFGVQTDIENFKGLPEARAWCVLHKIRPVFEFAGVRLKGKQPEVLIALRSGEASATVLSKTVASTIGSVLKLAAEITDLVTVSSGEKPGARVLQLTKAGSRIAGLMGQ